MSSSAPLVLITCGPSREPIDSVRFISNHSTGQLGLDLCLGLQQAGFQCLCLRGTGATVPPPPAPARVLPFESNQDLQPLLQKIADEHPKPTAVLHAAALADFRPRTTVPGKLSGSEPHTLELVPQKKVIASLHELFPESLVVGWKFEVEGGTDQAVEKARLQVARHRTQACVINGPAYGEGFGFYQTDQPLRHLANGPELAKFLAQWIEKLLPCRE